MNDREVPDESERMEAERYVLEKELTRPRTNCFTLLKYFFIFITSVTGCCTLFFFFLRNLFPRVADFIQTSVERRPVAVFMSLFALFFAIGFILVLKPLIIGCVRLYQHYAPEYLRRQCLFKPTCSEYTILAIEKYGVCRGVRKSIQRFKRCNGTRYRIDYP
jgi:putative component of membrane protein insertase Oxa1/YidC/SpoIIIJ protein YidD